MASVTQTLALTAPSVARPSQRAQTRATRQHAARRAPPRHTGLRPPAAAARRAAIIARAEGEIEMVPLNDAELKAISSGDFPAESGVYGVYNDKDELQYLGLSRKIDVSLKVHAEELPAEAVKARAMPLPGASKEALQAAWKAWMQEHLNEAGALPPGNNPGEKRWQMRAKKPARPDLKLTSGKGLADLNVPLEKLIDECIKATPVIAFVKGTKEMPQCGFSHRMMLTLNNLGADYEVVNVLDEVYNPGVREAIKEYSAWPTIPQLYIQGEFVGGADVVDEMLVSGELQEMLAGVKGAASK